MRKALENVVEGNDLAYSRRSTMQGWPGSDFRRIAVAALASTAPVAEAGQKEEKQ